MRIALLTTDSREHFKDYKNPRPYFGSAPTALLEGFAMLPDVEVHVVSCVREPVAAPEKIGPNIFYHALVVPKIGWMMSGYQGCIRAVRSLLKIIRPDIVHGQGTERECAMGAAFSGFPNIVTIHGNMAELARLFRARIGSFGWLAGKLETLALRRTRGVFCNSVYTESLVRPRAKKTWRVPNAIRLAFFEETESSTRNEVPVVLNVGVISPRKRQVELLQVAQELHARGVRVEFHFIGASDPTSGYGSEFHARIREAEAGGYAKYLGEKNIGDLVRCMDSARALIHFPSEEAFGLVVAEALARNLKFFGARLGGIQDIASGFDGAELFAGNDWRSLGDAIERWAKTGAPRASSASATTRERYHPSVIAARHIEIYREVLEMRPSRA